MGECGEHSATRLAREKGMSQLMTLSNPDLWRRIESFEIDDGVPTLTFAARLARENGWTPEFARRVVTEYKRFVYLAMVAGHRVTPSEHVDQAWHLHLTYTDSYWKRLCTHVLPRALEHTPTRGGEMEDDKFEDWYARTLESYEREFGGTPPRDIWPDAATRFEHDLQWRRVNTADHLVLSRRTTGGLVVLTGFALCAAAVIGVLESVGTAAGPGRWVGFVGAAGVVVMIVGSFIAGPIAGHGLLGRGSGSGGCGGFGGGGCGGGGCGGGGCGGGCGG